MNETTTMGILAILYANSLLGLGLLPLRKILGHRVTPASPAFKISIFFGRLEYYGWIARDLVCVIVAIAVLSGHSTTPRRLEIPALLLVLILLDIGHRFSARVRLSKQLATFPDPHPDRFFELVYAHLGPLPPIDLVEIEELDPSGLNFSHRAPFLSPKFAFGLAVFDTGLIANIAITASTRFERDNFRTIFDALTRLWSSRTASRLCLKLEVTGHEHLEQVQHQAMIAYNHESLMDFCLAFFATGGCITQHGRRLAPRFIAAKDHFQDNFFIHTVLGVGRAMDTGGMIFVDRKTRGAAKQAIYDACEVLDEQDVDVAIYPQGTRALSHRSKQGDVVGAGYYTTGRGPVPGQGHFRRGAAVIVSELSRTRPVDILPVGIVGTATVVPAQSFEIGANRTVRFHIMPPIHIAQGQDIEEEALIERVELSIRKTARVHQRLLDGWQRDTQSTHEEREALSAALAHWDESPCPTPFALLDAILSRSPSRRADLLKEFSRLALHDADETAWLDFSNRRLQDKKKPLQERVKDRLASA
ncbi:MAG: lysophospholipid acyltransferase family protein [Myxococcota bacterium]|nr:lysophospholipid acyltransferase family protein [Myxococcota bacterium]